MKNITALVLAVAWTLGAMAQEIGYVEQFALSTNRAEALKELVPNNLDATKVCSKLKPRTTIMSSTSSSLPRPLLPKSEGKPLKQPANYDLVKILGRGATGLTVLAVDKKTLQRVAIKRVEVDDDSQVSAYDASECV